MAREAVQSWPSRFSGAKRVLAQRDGGAYGKLGVLCPCIATEKQWRLRFRSGTNVAGDAPMTTHQ